MDNDLSGFLQTRRARIRPEDVGLPPYGRRRVPGLRREEVAQLAGVSVDYYIRLEQGRGRNVSESVLTAVCRVLQLTDTEQEHLRSLIRPAGSGGSGAARPAAGRTGGRGGQTVRPGLRLLLDSMTAAPAFVLGRRMDVLAWNRLADAVAGFAAKAPAELNQARQVFLDPAAPTVYPDWPAIAAETVAHLRLDAGRHPEDPALAALVGELSLKSTDFRRLWADHQVKEKTYGLKRMVHPAVGELEFGYETLQLPADPDQLLVAYTVTPGSPTAERLALL
ncbi:XRE family transcriptional regulator [Kitasatospora sp. MMS16-BH015]|uniref:helix-turn-helix transcriptional regulator n=1 Tax=Kitasatospora sp. MMS16-BH015 TaxID=2018025 RepID=UPI000CA210E9|nr:helix-turn-helix transcriptional regulator [Kitasatospora sp. MMS16-BH015]AUG78340.1 XRE family transcriptional regulator [Kitasatospora sp. MMS16-BH015]